MGRDEGCMVRQVPSTGGGGLYLDHQRMKECCREIFRRSFACNVCENVRSVRHSRIASDRVALLSLSIVIIIINM